MSLKRFMPPHSPAARRPPAAPPRWFCLPLGGLRLRSRWRCGRCSLKQSANSLIALKLGRGIAILLRRFALHQLFIGAPRFVIGAIGERADHRATSATLV